MLSSLKSILYRVLEDPASRAKRIFDWAMMLVVTASIVALILSLDPSLPPADRERLFLLDDLFIALFATEYLLRLWVCSNFGVDYRRAIKRLHRRWPERGGVWQRWEALKTALHPKWVWMRQPLSIIDLIAILPYFRPLRMFRVLVVFRVLKLLRYSRDLAFLGGILRERAFELLALATVVALVWAMVAIGFYSVEMGSNPTVDSIWKAFWWAIVTITTVGYGDIVPVTLAGKAVGVVAMIFGIGVFAFFTSIIASALTERLITLKEHHMERRIETLHDHMIVCGLGDLGRTVCQTLLDEGTPFVVIDKNPQRVARAVQDGWTAVEGDASDGAIWTKVGLDKARGVISAIGDEATNVYLILTVREHAPGIFIVARSGTAASEQRLRKVGANRVISPALLGGVQMAHTALRPSASNFFDLVLHKTNVDLSVEELTIPKGGNFDGMKLRDSRIREDFEVMVVGIVEVNKALQFSPSPNTEINAGDVLICLGNLDNLERLRRAIRG
ncbi:MAG: hypothetical protein AUJ55_00045 [Proteobacteria bacterium CG1_02_64_396]|nr:MAG: hypothetical protein AUJ55_00045 [Proteobacteria bacterium CG1_02_64_396]